VALLVFIVPIIDTTTVTINRLLKGKSPFVGGRDHTTHHLSYLGLSDKQVAKVFLGLSFLSVMFLGNNRSSNWCKLGLHPFWIVPQLFSSAIWLFVRNNPNQSRQGKVTTFAYEKGPT
jgi:hypothetical protein